MPEWIEIEQAATLAGLRVVLPPGIPGPWGEAIKGVLWVKKIPYINARHDLVNHAPLISWTKQASTPVLVYNDERPRSVWNDQINLAERIQPSPPLVPESIDDRIAMFGLCNLLAGENGFGWLRRLMLVSTMVEMSGSDPNARKNALTFGSKYGYSPEAATAAPGKCAEILTGFSQRLAAQRSRGIRYLVGDRLSAADIYWAAFAALVKPLPDELCPMLPRMRVLYDCKDRRVVDATSPELLAHRDFIYREHLELPVAL